MQQTASLLYAMYIAVVAKLCCDFMYTVAHECRQTYHYHDIVNITSTLARSNTNAVVNQYTHVLQIFTDEVEPRYVYGKSVCIS